MAADGTRRIEKRWPLWAARCLRFWCRTIRLTAIGFEQLDSAPPGVAFAVWHGDEMGLISHFGHMGPTVLVSQSKDGEIFARALVFLGYQVERGSSTRRAVGGLLALIRAVRGGRSVVFAVDGPQGPRWVCKPGAVHLARKTGAPLYPVGVAVSRRWVFRKTWHQTYLPVPFAAQVVVLGEPLYFPRHMDEAAVQQGCRQVEKALHRARRKAEDRLGIRPTTGVIQ